MNDQIIGRMAAAEKKVQMPISQKELLSRLARKESLAGVEIGAVDFSGYCFKKTMNFAGAVFKGKTIFYGTQFLERVNFREAQFSGKGGADFSEAKFSGEGGANFWMAEFSGEGRFVFERTCFKEDLYIGFRKVIIKNPQNMMFIDIKNLGGFLFLYTDVENIVFKNVTFRKLKRRFFGRELIADEVSDETDEIWDETDEVWDEIDEVWDEIDEVSDETGKEKKATKRLDHFNQVEILYRQLKRNFEDQRDYERAGDFHYGEMEMKRKQIQPRWRQFVSLNFLYKVISGYGQKWSQGLISFLVLAVLFSIPNMYWIHLPKEKEEARCLSHYEVCPEVNWPQTFLFTLRVMTLNKPLNYEPKKEILLGGFAIFLQYLTGPTVITLMVLAIRRKFRR